MVDEKQLTLFAPERLPTKPYCMYDKGYGTLIRHVSIALGMPYIQANSPWLLYRLILDVDADIQPTAKLGAWHDDFGMPSPNWTAINPDNGHGHLGYEIAIPIARHDTARQKPIRLAAAIEDALIRKVRADAGYAGLICKNPTHPKWDVVKGRDEPYELAELCDWVDLAPYGGKKPKVVPNGALGRNCTLFEQLRVWAYRMVMRFKRAGNRDGWDQAVMSKAESLNTFSPQLPFSEVKATARSVAKWCWRNIGDAKSNADFSAKQAFLGKRGGLASGQSRFNASLDKRNEAVRMRQEGATVTTIAGQLGIATRTVKRWLKG